MAANATEHVTAPHETDAVRGSYDKTADKYNRQISLVERACPQAPRPEPQA